MNEPEELNGTQNEGVFTQGSLSFYPATSVAETPPEAVDLNGKWVLIIDDDPVFLEAAAMRLQRAGCQVKAAEGSAQAITALAAQSFDAVLLDINFTRALDGFQMLKGLRALRGGRHARFLIVSSSDEASDVQRAEEAGISHFFQKPVNFARLFSVLASWK